MLENTTKLPASDRVEVATSGARPLGERPASPANSEMDAAFDNMEQGFMVLDDQRRVTKFSSRLQEILGFPDGALRLGASARDLITVSAGLGHYPGRDVEQTYEAWTLRLAERRPGSHLGHRPDGGTLKVGYAPFGDDCWVVTYEDISARVDAENALAEQNERFDAALTNIPHGVCMFDADKRLILCNASYSRLYALPPALTLAGTPLQAILDYRVSAGSAPAEMSSYFDVVDEAKIAASTRSTRVRLQDGRTIHIAHNPMSAGGYVSTHEDITKAVQAEERILYLGLHDELTGLPNRGLLYDRMGETLARVKRHGMFGVHYLDLDKFKSINDAHGHTVGDILLKKISERLRSCLSEVDTLARLGGDEFVVLQASLEMPEQAADLARRLVEAMSEPFDLDGREVYLGVSIGISICPADGADVETILRRADMAMYRAKSEGRNTYRFFELAMDARLQKRRMLELDLRRAVSSGEFELHYQPQVDAKTEAITGCEALLRWRHPSRGMVPPLEFIPIAEEIGVIIPLGAWVIQQACRDAVSWPDHIGVAVNLSSAQFRGPSLVQTVVSALGASGLPPHRLELEITESVLLADDEVTIRTLNHLRELGVRIAMDDFGTGYSSLSYLRSFPFDKIKIDRSFIGGIGEKEECAAIVKAIATLGAALGMTITAEGVETIEQFLLVRDHGCTEVQGYFFGRPCPVDELRHLFHSTLAAA
jgi:diguanylate cyclase (GGDEF)-like protein